MLKEYIQSVRSLSIIGMCKNAGKTTVLNKLIAELNESRVRLGLTSIGRDGESTDLVTRTAKPAYTFMKARSLPRPWTCSA